MLGACALLAVLVLLASCASFPDAGPHDWHDKIEGVGELGGPPAVANPPTGEPPRPDDSGSSSAPRAPSGCTDPDPQVVATCLAPIGAIAVLPDGLSALVGERTTGRVLRVRQGDQPTLVTTIPVDASTGGGLTGLVLSPAYAEDQLVYAYVTTPTDNRIVKLAPGEPPKPVLVGIPRGPVHNAGALGVGPDGLLLVATGDTGINTSLPGSLAGKVLRIDTLGRPGESNPDPESPVLSTGISDPGGICLDDTTEQTWVPDHADSGDVLHLIIPGPLTPPAWRWTDSPGVSGCTAHDGMVTIAENAGAATYVLHADKNGLFSGQPQTVLKGTYGRLGPATNGPDGFLWLGTLNKSGGTPVSSDDRVIRIQINGGGGAGRA
ncbi:MAG: PQQ-dependent sugar dehydrogenase [Pseudonocardiales bacterium]|nr:PQQ-dependent sugar dehydrogenase [Pseudonocardiales bacterium]